MQKNKRPWLKWLLVVLVLAALGGGGWWYWNLRANDAPQYQTADVVRGDLTQVVTATGQLNPVTNVTVGSQISGMIQTLSVDFNSPVTKGQLIAQIDPAIYKATVQQDQGDLANAEAARDLAQVNEKRAKELLASKLIPQSDYDTAVAALHQSEAMVLVKQAALAMANVNLGYCSIYSPVNGTVISRSVDVGQTVAASLSAPTLFIIANNLAQMQIDANVAEADIGGVAEGQDVDFTVDAFPMRTFHGKVVQVRNSPITVQNVVTYDTVVSVNNADLKLKPGMTANVSIVVATRDDTLKIPNAALRFRPPDAPLVAHGPGNGSGHGSGGADGGHGSGGRPKGDRKGARTIYVLGANGKWKAQPIKIGISDGIFTEVLDGLSESNKVIIVQISPQPGAANQASSPLSGMRRF